MTQKKDNDKDKYKDKDNDKDKKYTTILGEEERTRGGGQGRLGALVLLNYVFRCDIYPR